MNKQLLTLALITGLVMNSFADIALAAHDKTKPSDASLMALPVLTNEDLEAIIAEMEADPACQSLEIAPQTYQIFDKDDNLIMEETVPFENSPSIKMKASIRKGDFLFEKGDLMVFKIF